MTITVGQLHPGVLVLIVSVKRVVKTKIVLDPQRKMLQKWNVKNCFMSPGLVRDPTKVFSFMVF